MTDAQQTSSTADLELRHDTAAHALQALDGGRVVGEAHYTPYETDGRSQRIFDHTLTQPSHRGRGIGTWLAHWLQDRARSLGSTVVGMPMPQGSPGDRLME